MIAYITIRDMEVLRYDIFYSCKLTRVRQEFDCKKKSYINVKLLLHLYSCTNL